MEKLNPDKLNVEFMYGVTLTEPVIGRKYTLTHSDITADLYLSIGLEYAYDEINKMRDEVIAEWENEDYFLYLYVYVYVDGQFGPVISAVRNAVFRRELPLALEAIVYGDRRFFDAHPELQDAPIWIYFDSSDPNFNRFEKWGTPKDYE
jgi:hypothetical protein